ncbi:hypothetical protein WJX81_006557 [Elliptochloris bilobata]|uniref:Steroid 5-alpha reductase C-terminal domain-containing protein n=1 Tax=Elliptochloris bilobata TaxID=381761 RepID=A0AAW1RGY0_9CHLO
MLAGQDSSCVGIGNTLCYLGLRRPVSAVAALYFGTGVVLFWTISLAQQSTWLIDPYWTLAPLLIAHFYRAHPAAAAHSVRANACTSLLWTWSLRLTHSYFRREKWQVGAREDWRYTELRERHPRSWWWLSFFAVYLIQEVMLVGITLPMYAVHFRGSGWNGLDSVALMMCITGLWTAALADTQLHEFCAGNEALDQQGRAKRLVLDTGLWRHSRHPNHVGEQLWWWGLALFGVSASGELWPLLGTAFNSAVMVEVSLLVERRMLRRADRAAAYRAYQTRTPFWLGAAAAGLKELDAAKGDVPACPLTCLELRYGGSWIFSRSRHGEQATWEDISSEVRRDVKEDMLRFGDTAPFVAICALAHSSYSISILRDHYSREVCGVAASEAKKCYGLSDACLRALPRTQARVCFRGRGAGAQLSLPDVMRAAQRRYGCPEGKARAERARRERDAVRRAALGGQGERVVKLGAELAALGLPQAAMENVLARRYMRGTWEVSAAGAAAGVARRRFLAALPGCAGALRLAACDWACDELGDQALSDRRMAAVEVAAEVEALQEWAQRCGCASAALAEPSLPPGMHEEVADLFSRLEA